MRAVCPVIPEQAGPSSLPSRAQHLKEPVACSESKEEAGSDCSNSLKSQGNKIRAVRALDLGCQQRWVSVLDLFMELKFNTHSAFYDLPALMKHSNQCPSMANPYVERLDLMGLLESKTSI